jgi:hypothetical protein
LLIEQSGRNRFEAIARAIDDCKVEIKNASLVRIEDCNMFIAAVDADLDRLPTIEQAIECARSLLGAYGRVDAPDPDRFVSGIAKVMTFYPLSIVELLCDDYHGMPGSQKKAPNAPAEIKEWCDRILVDRRRLKWKAKAIINERLKRDEEARREDLLAAERSSQSAKDRADAVLRAIEQMKNKRSMRLLDD